MNARWTINLMYIGKSSCCILLLGYKHGSSLRRHNQEDKWIWYISKACIDICGYITDNKCVHIFHSKLYTWRAQTQVSFHRSCICSFCLKDGLWKYQTLSMLLSLLFFFMLCVYTIVCLLVFSLFAIAMYFHIFDHGLSSFDWRLLFDQERKYNIFSSFCKRLIQIQNFNRQHRNHLNKSCNLF